jgi:hypothetical protein
MAAPTLVGLRQHPPLGETAMNSALPQEHSQAYSPSLPSHGLRDQHQYPVTKDQLNQVLEALAIPFDLAVIQWRVTEYREDGKHGLMLPYADPRAYSDRLNDLFTPPAGAEDTPYKPACRFSGRNAAQLRRSWLPAK